MIPAGAAHNEILLGDSGKKLKGKPAKSTEEGMVLV